MARLCTQCHVRQGVSCKVREGLTKYCRWASKKKFVKRSYKLYLGLHHKPENFCLHQKLIGRAWDSNALQETENKLALTQNIQK